jgi:hypothetical protein
VYGLALLCYDEGEVVDEGKDEMAFGIYSAVVWLMMVWDERRKNISVMTNVLSVCQSVISKDLCGRMWVLR